MVKAVFLDRDGTLIEDRGHLSHPSEVVFYPNAVECLRRLQDAGFALFIITNQSGVAKGELTPQDVDRVNRYVCHYLAERGIDISAVYVCPHHRSDGCDCIKPNPHFLHRAAQEHGIDLSRTYSVGDHPCDAQLAENAGGRGVYVLSGHGEKHRSELEKDTVVVQDVAEAAEWILGQESENVPAR